MKKIRRFVLNDNTQVLSHESMKSLLGGSNNVYIYWCVCYNSDGSKQDATIKVTPSTNPETAVLYTYCQNYTNAVCTLKATV